MATSAVQPRFAASAAKLDGRVLERTDAYGKHLFHHWEGEEVLHVHLGLIGVFRRHPAPPPPPGAALRLRLGGERATWDLSGPMICRLGPPSIVDEVIEGLGPDPLRPEHQRGDRGLTRFARAVSSSRKPIGALLLDQRVVAGIGNVYRAELCFLEGIHPAVEGRKLGDDRVEALWRQATHQLRLGLKRNRIVTIGLEELAIPLDRVRRGDGTYVYGQDHCRRCGSPTVSFELAGRTIWACPIEQPAP